VCPARNGTLIILKLSVIYLYRYKYTSGHLNRFTAWCGQKQQQFEPPERQAIVDVAAVDNVDVVDVAVGIKRITNNNNNNNSNSNDSQRDEVLNLTPLDGHNRSKTVEEKEEQLDEEQTGLFGLSDNFESSLDYFHMLLALMSQIDESVLVFLIVMLICAIVYACEYFTHTHTQTRTYISTLKGS